MAQGFLNIKKCGSTFFSIRFLIQKSWSTLVSEKLVRMTTIESKIVVVKERRSDSTVKWEEEESEKEKRKRMREPKKKKKRKIEKKVRVLIFIFIKIGFFFYNR